jgi:hypothetical protein
MHYADLLEAAKLNPETVNFKELRISYTQSVEYNPYNLYIDTYKSIANAIHEKDLSIAIKEIGRLLETCYLDIDAHALSSSIYERMEDEAKSTYHLKFVKGILKSILQPEDGRSYETAFVVISIQEEHAVLRSLGIKPTNHSLKDHEGHQFDVFDFCDPETGQATKIYFNIDFPKGWLDRSLLKT